MKINVEGIAPFAKDQIIEIVTHISGHSFNYLEKEEKVITTLVFETDEEDVDRSLECVKKAIKSSEIGKMIAFRVVPSGSVFYFKK